MRQYETATMTLNSEIREKLDIITAQLEHDSGIHIGFSCVVRAMLTHMIKQKDLKKIVLEYKANG